MPYMFSQGAADIPCTLLHFVGSELIDVAKGRIVQPSNPVFHGNPMPPTMYRVEVVRVLQAATSCYLRFDLLRPTKKMR